MKYLALALALLSLAACNDGDSKPTPKPTVVPKPSPVTLPSVTPSPLAKKFFPVGVWYQPASSFAKWKARGVNTMLGLELEGGAMTFPDWQAALAKNDLYSIREVRGAPAEDAKDVRLSGWLMGDEPDIAYNNGDKNSSPAAMMVVYKTLKAAAPNTPVFTNVSGAALKQSLYHWSTVVTRDALKGYGAATDVLGFDLYPITGWDRADWIDLSMPIFDQNEKNSKIRMNMGWVMDELSGLAPGKPIFAAIETSDQKLPMVGAKSRAVTPDEFRGEIWHSVIHGAKGIYYFADCIGTGWCGFDTTPDAVAAEMTKQDALLQANAGWLLTPGSQVAVPVPFEKATWISHTVTLNLSHAPATLNGVTYAPYEVKIEGGK